MSDEKKVATSVGREELLELEAAERVQSKSARERARFAREAFNHGHGDRNAAMSQLARAFPSIEDAAGLDPFDPHELAEWVQGSRSDAQICAVRFILSVWNTSPARDGDYGLSFFDMHEALLSWDKFHRQAFAGWAEDPWWA